MTQTHETYINAIVAIARSMVANDPEKLKAIDGIKVLYGLGQSGLRGVTYYAGWKKGDETKPVIEVCAFGQESWTQVAGTTIHELAHVVAGPGTGHSKAWKEACATLGLRLAKATGHRYSMAGFHPKVRLAISALPLPSEGSPATVASLLGLVPRIKPCTMGVGTRGGKSRGVGSGSRLIKCQCGQCGYTVRTTRTWLDKGYPICPTDNQPMEEE